MPRRSSYDPLLLPHLSPSELAERDNQESCLAKELLACWQKDQFDLERAYAFTRSYSVETFLVLLDVYRKKPGFAPGWLPQMVNEAILRVLGVADKLWDSSFGSQQWSELGDALEATIIEHLRHDPRLITRSDFVAAFPKESPPDAAEQPVGRRARERHQLWEAYSALFPEVRKLDVCWTAKQHYREWKRWINNELPDGNTADRAFRRVLTSGKHTSALRPEPRPKGWQ